MFCTEKNAPASHIRTKCKSKAMFSMYITSIGVKHEPPDTNQLGGHHTLFFTKYNVCLYYSDIPQWLTLSHIHMHKHLKNHTLCANTDLSDGSTCTHCYTCCRNHKWPRAEEFFPYFCLLEMHQSLLKDSREIRKLHFNYLKCPVKNMQSWYDSKLDLC